MHNRRITTDNRSYREAVGAAASRIKADSGLQVAYLDNPLVTGNKQLISRDRHSVAILFSSNLTEAKIEDQIDRLRSIVRTPGFDTYVTGTAAQNFDYANSSKEDLSRGETFTVPILILILLVVFGTAVA